MRLNKGGDRMGCGMTHKKTKTKKKKEKKGGKK